MAILVCADIRSHNKTENFQKFQKFQNFKIRKFMHLFIESANRRRSIRTRQQKQNKNFSVD